MSSQNTHSPNRVQIKICGLTLADQAVECIDAGADAIGLIFYPKSPRYVSPQKAKEISAAIDGRASVVGVFVDETVETVAAMSAHCGLDAVQLHGQEPPEGVSALMQDGIVVIKALFLSRRPGFSLASTYSADAFLVECGQGKLPGGNARRWNWSAACNDGLQLPVVLAGGLTPENIVQAIQQGQPDAVDVSSGVEKKPGIKDLQRVRRFVSAVNRSGDIQSKYIRRVF